MDHCSIPSTAYDVIKDKEQDPILRKMAHLIIIIRMLGWKHLGDNTKIVPNTRPTYCYMLKNYVHLRSLFTELPEKLEEDNLINTLNPILLKEWNVRIIHESGKYYMQLLVKTK